MTAVRPPARFGHLEIDGSQVMNFAEKNRNDSSWINGGYFVLEPEVIEFLSLAANGYFAREKRIELACKREPTTLVEALITTLNSIG